MATTLNESSPDVIAAFMQQTIVEYQNYGMLHRRSEPRECVAIPIRVQCLNEALEPIGEPFHSITRDISCGGMGLFHGHRIDARYLQIIMRAPQSHEQMRLLAKVEHQTRCGGYYLIGCRFAGNSEQTGQPVTP